MDQTKAPLYEALERFGKQRVVPFDVPGHKRGRGSPALVNPINSGMDEQEQKGVTVPSKAATQFAPTP